MKSLQENIRESLFDGQEIDTEEMSRSIEDKHKQEVLQNCTGEDARKGLLIFTVENGMTYIDINNNTIGGTLEITFEDNVLNDILPLNIKRITGRCYSFFITLRHTCIKSMKDVFAPDFKDDVDYSSSKDGLCIFVHQNPNLSSLEGCPERIRKFSCLYNPALKSFKGIPRWIGNDIVCSTPDEELRVYTFARGTTEYNDGLAAGQRNPVIAMRELKSKNPDAYAANLKFFTGVTRLLDARCEPAKEMKKALRILKKEDKTNI